MTVERRMQAAEEGEGASVMDPLMRDRLFKSRSVFAPGRRIRMNIVPMFLNVFVPWGCFVFCCGVMAFWVMYAKPMMGWFLIGCAVLFWLCTVAAAVWARKHDADPTWFTYLSLMCGIFIVAGVLVGRYIYSNYTGHYYAVSDLKVLSNVDTGRELGQNVMDAGLFYFADGNHIDPSRSWHFQHGSLYCVAPIIGNQDVPESQSFDFWAVGKDCCSVASSDFRCGAFRDPAARSGIRIMEDGVREYYRLAVEQAESLYGIMATHPIFFEWTTDPRDVVQGWNSTGFGKYLVAVCFAFVVSLFCMSMATCRYAWMGRTDNAYGMTFSDDPDWAKGGVEHNKLPDYHTHSVYEGH